MTISPVIERVFERVTFQRCYHILLVSLFLLIMIGHFIAWPIMMYDTDLWYHLSGGRYFWQNGIIAHDAFFSYVTPPKSWYNYYWLFQVVIYKIFQWTGYYGLIVLRCLLYGLTALFICLFFFKRRDNQTELLLGLFLFICCTVAIMNRELLVRPHLFSYLFIVVFLYILEFKRDKIWLLPLLGIFWSNIHGIEYPVMFLIVFAYIVEIYWKQFRKIRVGDYTSKGTKWLLISAFYTIFVTPGVIELVRTPFETAAYQHLYVAELLPIPFYNFFVFAPVTVKGLISLLKNMIVLLPAFIFLVGLWKRKLRVSHAILFIGAILLLSRHNRFSYEFMLLSLPLLHHGVSLIAERIQFPRKFVNVAMPVVLIFLPLLVFSSEFSNRPAYPFSPSNLPTGVVQFLNRHALGGRILNEPNTGGYLPWALNKNFNIFMDMQMSIFSDTDFATAHNAFSNVTIFKSFIRTYDPSFISVSLNRKNFDKIVENDARYMPVFFDHAELLYVNRTHYSDLADRYALKVINPFRFRDVKYETESAEKLSAIFAEAMKIRDEDPANYSANHILASISVVLRQYDQALSFAEAIVRHYPEQSHGYALKADALLGMERYQEAARLYEKALEMGQTAKSENVYWNLHTVYVKMKEYKKGYKLLSKYVNPFATDTDYKDIYQLGMSAAAIGKTREGITFLKVARMKAPPEDNEYIQKIDKNLVMLGGISN